MLLVPEALLELAPQRLGFEGQPRRQPVVVQVRGEARRDAIGEIDVALHFAERDRPGGEAAVGVEHRIVGVLPALVAQTARALAVVLCAPVS